MLVALKCVVAATLYCFVTGIEAVAHERLQSAAFDPLAGHESRRLRVNSRYLQNTLEQLVTFAVGLFGLAIYLTNGESMRTLPAVTIIWIINRFAFWIGYHRSAALRGLGAPGVAIGLVMLLYVAWRIGSDIAGTGGAIAAVAAFLAIEAVLFWKTRQ
jgi:MAPEG family.